MLKLVNESTDQFYTPFEIREILTNFMNSLEEEGKSASKIENLIKEEKKELLTKMKHDDSSQIVDDGFNQSFTNRRLEGIINNGRR